MPLFFGGVEMIILPIAVAVAANVLYHVASKSIAPEQNAFMGLVVNYATALTASAILFWQASRTF